MSELQWKASSFDLHSSPRPLKYAVLLISFSLVAFFIFSALFKIEKTVIAEGEVGAFDGEKLVVASHDGNLKAIHVRVGDKVAKGQVLAQIQIPFADESLVAKVLQQIKVQYDILYNHKDNLSDLDFPKWKEIKSENPNLTKLILEAESTWEKYKLADRSLKLLAKKQLHNAQIQKGKLLVKINSLKKSSQKSLLNSLIDELEEKLQKLESDQLSIREDAHSKIAVSRTDALNSLRNLSLQINEFYEAYQIKAYSDGVVARSMLNSFQHIVKDQAAFSIIPSGGRFNAVLKVPSIEVGSIEISQSVHMAIDSFPYQRFGYFTGKVESIDQSISNEDNKHKVFIVRSSLDPPKQSNRDIASFVRVLPGMKIEAYIETRKLSLLRIIYEKIFTNDTQ